MSVTSSIFNNWVPQPELHNAINGFIGQLAFTDGTFKSRYCASQMLSKFADPANNGSAIARQRAAFEKLQATELRNQETTRRLAETREFPRELHMARVIIWDVLGEFNVEELYDRADFSGGASQSRSRRNATKYMKFNGCSHITDAAKPYLRALERSCQTIGNIFLQQGFYEEAKTAYCNTLFTVPKSDTIDRICAKEPDWNMYFQKGLGSMIRSRLRRAGIDLNDQSINRDLARVGSIKNNLATLDLSSASDSITSELVYQLLPTNWFKHLDRLRCPLGLYPDGKLVKWSLFSTMGNGFTFELESLIFYALAKAVCYTNGIKGVISVYGDDIIVPSKAALPLIELLKYCGFSTNEDKTFIEGPFRESCGGHYYNGQDVTPFYIKSPILTVEDLVLVLNKLRKWASQDLLDPRTNEPMVCDPRLSEWFRELVSLIPNAHLITGGPIELSSRYISGRGTAMYHIVKTPRRSGKKSQPRRVHVNNRNKLHAYFKVYGRDRDAYAYWLVHRNDDVLNTTIADEGVSSLRRNRAHSNSSAPYFSYEYEGDPVELT